MHQIRQLIDDDDDIWHLVRNLQLIFTRNLDLTGGASSREPGVAGALFSIGILLVGVFLFLRSHIETHNVAHANARKNFVTTLHLIDQPAQCEHHFFWIDHYREREMRQRTIRLKFDHFRVNDHQTQLVRGETKEHAGDQGIDTNTLPTASGTGDQQMRHLRQVGNDRFAVNIFA